jgi:hypothetical protein
MQGDIMQRARWFGAFAFFTAVFLCGVVLSAEKNDKADEAGDKVKGISFDDVKLDLKKDQPFKDELLTPAVKKLDGKQVRIRGYILPSFQQSGIKQFVLVRDNMECCFGPGAALHDCIVVEMTGGATTDFTVRPVTVEGKFSIKQLADPEGKTLAIYRLDGKSVK